MKQNGCILTDGVFIDPTTDVGFKILFGRESSKDILISLLNSILENDLEEPIKEITFLDKEKQRPTEGERTVIFDLHCVTSNGYRFIVEMQNLSEQWFVERCLLYASRAIIEQSKSGDWNYYYMPVISIAFTNFTLKGYDGQYLIDGSLVERYSNKLLSDRLRLIFIQLPQFSKRDPEECQSILEEWIYTIKNIKHMNTIPFAHNNPVFRRVEELARKENLSSDERREYERGLKTYQDYYAAMVSSYENGMEKGIEKGVEKQRLEIILKMKACGLSDEQINMILNKQIPDA